MSRKMVAVWVSLLIIISSIVILVEIAERVEAPTTLYVGGAGGGNYSKIQWAIDNASDGDTVYVYNGIYYENVVVNKSINLTGEDINNTIVDGGGSGDVVRITADWVNITGFTVTHSGSGSGNAGIELSVVQECKIINNNVSLNNWFGIYLDSSSNNTITYSNVLNNVIGIYLISSSNNTITNNNVSIQSHHGILLDSSNNNIITENNVSSNGDIGISLWLSSKNIIVDNNLSNNYKGIGLERSSNNNIIGNNILINDYGILIPTSSNNTIISNNISLNNLNGIYLLFSSNKNIITNNNISNNGHGIYFWPLSDNNIITNNNVSNNRCGINLTSSSNNTITGNNVSNNDYGINLTSSSNNKIYHNNIISNAIQAYDNQANNDWDDGYPLGGNYWSDYSGVDTLKGPYQNIPGSDGIGDTKYSIDSDSFDNYPLMEPFTYKLLENFTILNQGWNLISIPLIQDNQNLQKILEMIDGYYDAVQWYDITDTNDPWKHHKVGKPYGNDLFELNETMGFWIHITKSGETIFLYNGTQPTSNQTITLHPGWNMVGYPSLTSYNRTEGLNNITYDDQIDAIWSYNASTQKCEEMGESDFFKIGKGYYIHAKSECEWEVPL